MGGELVWTKEKPTEPGWYWHRSESQSPRIYHISHLEFCNSAIKCEYAGPIPMPAEPWDDTVTNENTKRGEVIEVRGPIANRYRRRFYLRDDDLYYPIVCYSGEGSSSSLTCWKDARRIREET